MAPRAEILLVEDDALLRREITRALQRRDYQVTAVATGAAGVADAARQAPDAALVDLGLPDMSGVEVIRALRTTLPACALVAFSVLDDATHVLAALRAGADGYITKTATTQALDDAIVAAMSGDMPLSPVIARFVAEAALASEPLPPREASSALPRGIANSGRAPAPGDAESQLTKRELELLSHLALGATYAECAETLSIGLGTVQTYVKSIYRKLDVSSKVGAIVVASERGLLRPISGPRSGGH